MSLNFKYIPLTFLKDQNQIKEQIRNTIILKYFFEKDSRTVALSNLIQGTQYGYNAAALQSGNNKFLRISDITDGEVDWNAVPYCDCSDEATYLLEDDDILIARTGGTTGKSFLISNPPEKAIYAGYLIRIRANKGNAPEFLNLFLNSYAYWSQVLSLNKGEFRPSVNASKLKDLILPNCSKEEQLVAIQISKGIVLEGFEELQNEINVALSNYDNCQKILSHLSEQKEDINNLKQSILQEAIQGKLTAEWRAEHPDLISGESSAENLLKRIKTEKAQLVKDKKIKKEKPLPPITDGETPFELPSGWVWCRLGEITNYGSSQKVESESISSNTWVLDLEDIEKTSSKIIQRRKFHERPSLSTKSIFKKGWILYSKLRPYLDKIVVVDEDGVCTTEILPLPVFGNMVPEFMMFGMKGKHFLNYVNSRVSGMKMPRLKTEDGKLALIPLAPLPEQKAIVEKVAALMQKCSALEEEITTSEANAQMLMQAVLKEAFKVKVEEKLEPAL